MLFAIHSEIPTFTNIFTPINTLINEIYCLTIVNSSFASSYQKLQRHKSRLESFFLFKNHSLRRLVLSSVFFKRFYFSIMSSTVPLLEVSLNRYNRALSQRLPGAGTICNTEFNPSPTRNPNQKHLLSKRMRRLHSLLTLEYETLDIGF